MKLATITALLVSLVLVAEAAQADEALAQSKGCLGCHAVDKKVLGPAYKDVAAKYAGQNVVDQLAQKVIKGGGGVWGQMPMPPNSVTPEEAKILVQWVLSRK
jgi:cytochrome c